MEYLAFVLGKIKFCQSLFFKQKQKCIFYNTSLLFILWGEADVVWYVTAGQTLEDMKQYIYTQNKIQVYIFKHL